MYVPTGPAVKFGLARRRPNMKIDELREEALQILEQNGLEQLEGAGGALEDHVFVALDLEDQAGAKLFAAHLRVTDVAMQKPDEEVARQIAEDQKVGAPLVRAFWLTIEQFAGWLRATQKAENLSKYDSF